MTEARPIAFFLPSLRGDGAERVMLNLAHGITERGHSADIVLAKAEGAFLEQLPPSVRLVDLRSHRTLKSFGGLVAYLRRERPRALISSMNHANIVALWAARVARTRTPVVATVHNTLSASTQGRMQRWLWTWLLRTFYPWAAHIVAVSKGAADDMARATGLPHERIQVIYNPVVSQNAKIRAQESPGHPWLAAGEPPVILGVGRLTRQKDFATLIRALAELRAHQRVRLIILGEGEERSALAALVQELGVTEDVAFAGFQKNALAYMAHAAVFVLSSAWEGLPTVLIEALSVGTPVVSTDCPSGPREILQDGRFGALVPVGDVAALAAAIQDVLEGRSCVVPASALAPFTHDVAVESYLRIVA